MTEHLQDSRENCPECDAQLQGNPIPEEHQNLFGATHGSRKIGIEDRDVYDGVAWWRCPDCKHVWKRFEWAPDYHD